MHKYDPMANLLRELNKHFGISRKRYTQAQLARSKEIKEMRSKVGTEVKIQKFGVVITGKVESVEKIDGKFTMKIKNEMWESNRWLVSTYFEDYTYLTNLSLIKN